MRFSSDIPSGQCPSSNPSETNCPLVPPSVPDGGLSGARPRTASPALSGWLFAPDPSLSLKMCSSPPSSESKTKVKPHHHASDSLLIFNIQLSELPVHLDQLYLYKPSGHPSAHCVLALATTTLDVALSGALCITVSCEDVFRLGLGEQVWGTTPDNSSLFLSSRPDCPASPPSSLSPVVASSPLFAPYTQGAL